MKNALVVEGGAMRGIFSAGVLDAFLLEHFDPFDLYIGVSAGASNIAAYLADMYQRNFKIYTTYSSRAEFINWPRFFQGGHLLDLDWLWEMTIKETRLDLPKIFGKHKEFVVVVTSVESGEAVYHEPDETTCEDLLKASCAIPLFYRKFPVVHSERVVDGGFADSIPVLEAYRRGARNIMVVRSRYANYVKKDGWGAKLFARFLTNTPNLQKKTRNRAASYQEALAFIRNPPQGVRVIEVTPPYSFKTTRLTRDVNRLTAGYQIGVAQGRAAIRQWRQQIP